MLFIIYRKNTRRHLSKSSNGYDEGMSKGVVKASPTRNPLTQGSSPGGLTSKVKPQLEIAGVFVFLRALDSNMI